MPEHLRFRVPDTDQVLTVLIYPTREMMWKAIRKGDDFNAYYESVPVTVVNGDSVLDEQPGSSVGYLYFARGYYGAGVVAHEIAHWVIDWGGRVYGFDDHEVLCDLAGEMTARFWSAHYEIERKNA